MLVLDFEFECRWVVTILKSADCRHSKGPITSISPTRLVNNIHIADTTAI